MSCVPFSAAPTSEDSARIMSRISCTERWLKISTFRPRLGQIARDVGLQVGEADHQIGFELQNLFFFRTQKSRNAGLLLPGPRRAHGVARDADDAPLFAEQVERLGAFLGEADDALGESRRHGVETIN